MKHLYKMSIYLGGSAHSSIYTLKVSKLEVVKETPKTITTSTDNALAISYRYNKSELMLPTTKLYNNDFSKLGFDIVVGEDDLEKGKLLLSQCIANLFGNLELVYRKVGQALKEGYVLIERK